MTQKYSLNINNNKDKNTKFKHDKSLKLDYKYITDYNMK